VAGLKVLFLGTPEFAVATLDAIHTGPHTVVGVVTQPDRPSGRNRKLRPSAVKAYAQNSGLPVFQPERLRDDEAFEAIGETAPDVAVVVAYGQILRQRFLDMPSLGCWNVHASLLPRWRGAAPINYAIWSGDSKTGVCLMRMERGLDTGPVYSRWETPIAPNDTAGELHDRLAPVGGRLISVLLDELAAGTQPELETQDDDASTYAHMLKKSDGLVDFSLPPVEFANHVHAMTPWPGAFCETNCGMLRLLRVKATTDESEQECGTILEAGKRLRVAVGGGVVEIVQCQKPGKRPMEAADFLRGFQRNLEGESFSGRKKEQ